MQHILDIIFIPDMRNIINNYIMVSVDDVKNNKYMLHTQLKNKRFFFIDFFCEISHDDEICDCNISLTAAMKSYAKSDFRYFIEDYGEFINEIDKRLK